MPRLMDDNMETGNIGGMPNFQFTGVRTEHLGATEYTVVSIAVDVTGSVYGFQDELRNMLITTVKSCKKSPRSDNLLLRVILFSTMFPGGIEELHGFKLLSEIDPDNDYPQLNPGGMTPLSDASYSGTGGVTEFAKKLMDDDYLANGLSVIITDGYDNASVATPNMTKQEVDRAVKEEEIESLITLLIGINASEYRDELERFKNAAGIDKYIDAGEVTEGKLAKLADFVSQSVSSQSQALGTGGASKNISATI